LVEAGVQLRREGKDLEALDEFQRANALAPRPRILAQIALAEQALGRWVAAENHLQAALASQEDAWIRDHRAELEQALATIARHLGLLTVETNATDAELWIDGTRRGPLPLSAQRVASGSVRIEVRRPGGDPVERTVDVAAGTELTEHVEFVVPTPAEEHGAERPPPAPVAAHRDHRRRESSLTPAWVMLGGAGVLLAGALAAQVIHETAAAHYNDDSLCFYGDLSRDERCGAYRGRAEAAQTLAVLGYVGAGVLGSASVLLFVTLPSSPRTTGTTGAGPSARYVGLELRGEL
jgi:tetratricopeptide (TPR) repeat protein